MAINKLVSIKVPVLEALGDMGVDHTKNLPDMIRWAVRAEHQIGSYYSYRKTIKVIEVDKFRIELPCEAVSVQRMLIGDIGCDAVDLYEDGCTLSCVSSLSSTSTSFSGSPAFLVVDRPSPGKFTGSSIKWEVQDNHIILNKNFDKTKVSVQYLGLKKDEEGFPMVLEHHTEAIVEFIMYRWAKRSRFSPNKMELGDVQMFSRNFAALCAAARADDSVLSESDRQEIIDMIFDPMVGYGMDFNMHDRSDY